MKSCSKAITGSLAAAQFPFYKLKFENLIRIIDDCLYGKVLGVHRLASIKADENNISLNTFVSMAIKRAVEA